MSDNSAIEWTDASWNPLRARNLTTGRVGWYCEHKSDGCAGCYAEGFNMRLGTGLPFKPGHRKDVEIFLDEKTLAQPMRWKRPRMIFVCSMSDLFADFVEEAWLDKVFAVAALCPQHTFQVLTKRPERMQGFIAGVMEDQALGISRFGTVALWAGLHGPAGPAPPPWPLPNVWLGVSCERQEEADERIPLLLQMPAAVRFVSLEPLLGPIDLQHLRLTEPDENTVYRTINALTGVRGHGGKFGFTDTCDPIQPHLGWAIVGGESGPKARPMHPQWARDLRDQCTTAGVSFFFKQWGEWREPIGDEDYDTSKGRGGNPPAFIISMDGTVHCFTHFGDDHRPVVIRVGKKAAGRLLDGRTWDEMPGRAA